MYSRRDRWLAAALVAAALAAIAFVVSRRQDPKLTALLSDPLVTTAVDGLTEVDRHTSESGTALGKPQHAGVTRVLSNGSPVATDAEVDRVAEVARAAGWTLTKQPSGAYHGERTIGGVRASVTILADRLRPPERVVVMIRALD